jgi:hypothetical protein
MPSAWIICHVSLVRTKVSEEHISSIIRVKRISKLGTMLEHLLLVTAYIVCSSLILVTLMMETIHFYKMSVLTRATQLNIPEYVIIQIFYLCFPEREILFCSKRQLFVSICSEALKIYEYKSIYIYCQ